MAFTNDAEQEPGDHTGSHGRPIGPSRKVTDEEMEAEAADARKVDAAIRLLNSWDLAEAEELLLDVVRRTPRNYVYEWADGDTHFVKFWDQTQFTDYAFREGWGQNGLLLWQPNAYGRCHYQLGWLAYERGDFDEAIRWYEAGNLLEPTQTPFLTEKGQALACLGQHEAALQTFEDVLNTDAFISPTERALALRGAGEGKPTHRVGQPLSGRILLPSLTLP